MPVSPLFSLVSPVTPSNTNGPLSQSNANNNGVLSPISSTNTDSSDLSQGQTTLSFFEQLQVANDLNNLPLGQEFAAYLPHVSVDEESPMTQLNTDFVGPLTPLTLEHTHNTDDASGILYSPINQAVTLDSTQVETPEGLQYLESLRRAQPHIQSQGALSSNMTQEDLVEGNLDTQAQVKLVQSELSARQAHIPEAAAKIVDPNLQAVNPAISMNAQNNKTINLDELSMDVLTEEITLDEASLDGMHLESESIHDQPKTLTALKENSMVNVSVNQESSALPDAKLNGMETITAGLKESTATKSMALDQGDGVKTQTPTAEKLASHFNKLDVPPQSPQWNDQVAKRISIMASESVQSARIQLDPPELGSLEIKVKVQNDQVSVAFGSNNQMVRDALESQTPRLRELLEQQGVDLADVNVSEQGRDQNGQDSNEALTQGGDQEGDAIGADPLTDQEIQTFESDALVDYFA